jgi:hypothetical protein
VLVTLTGIVGSLMFAAWAIFDRVIPRRATPIALPAVAPLPVPPVALPNA